MSRRIFGALVACALLLPGCKRDADLVEGGVYASPKEGGAYSICKVLAADEQVVHLRCYQESFKAVPAAIDTSKLSLLIGHAPMVREGFLTDHPKLITVEKVAESELEGYRTFQEAMG